MAIKIGNTNIGKAYLGETEIKKLYLGANVIFDNTLNTDAFIIEVNTSNSGSPSDAFQFTGAEGDYDVIAKQNNIVVATFNDLSDEATITLPSNDFYVLEVTPKATNGFNRIRFNNSGDNNKLTDIKQWGNIVWSSFNGSFFNCDNSLITATDSPNLSVCDNLGNMFLGSSLANPNLANWNFINIVDASRMMEGTPSTGEGVSNWDVSNMINMNRIFTNSNLSVNELTACYENWSQLNLQQNVRFSGGTTKYNSSGQAGRDILVNTYNWSITDGGPA